MKYQLPDHKLSAGYLILVPQMNFSCHGYITGWSALTRFSANNLAIDYLYHDITLLLWRPIGNGTFTFVGSKRLSFVGRTLRRGMTVVNGTQFFKFVSAHDGKPPLHFQPGDVVGWYIHSLVQSIRNALTVVYRNSVPSSNLVPVDLYSTVTKLNKGRYNAMPPCEVSIRNSDQTTVIPSVTPFVNVDYGKLPIYYTYEIDTFIIIILATVSTDGFTQSGQVGTQCINISP